MTSVENGPSGLLQSAADMLEKHKQARKILMEKEEKLSFSYSLEASLTDAEREANKKL